MYKYDFLSEMIGRYFTETAHLAGRGDDGNFAPENLADCRKIKREDACCVLPCLVLCSVINGAVSRNLVR